MACPFTMTTVAVIHDVVGKELGLECRPHGKSF